MTSKKKLQLEVNALSKKVEKQKDVIKKQQRQISYQYKLIDLLQSFIPFSDDWREAFRSMYN